MLKRLTKPVAISNWLINILSDPLLGGVMEPSSAFLMANPTPCSLFSMGLLPYQKNVYLSSLIYPEDRSLVSCKATISILSLSSSFLITAVFEHHLFIANHLPVQLSMSWHSMCPVWGQGQSFACFHFSCLLLCSDSLVRLCPSSTHPMEQETVMGQNLTGWELPSLRWAISVQMRLQWPLPPSEVNSGILFYVNQVWLNNQ